MLEIFGNILNNQATAGLLRLLIVILMIIVQLVIVYLIARFIIIFLKNWWLDEVQEAYAAKIKWSLLELKFPRDNAMSPKAMEAVFASLYQMYSFGITIEKQFIAGKYEEHFAAEMYASNDGIHFFVRLNNKIRNLFEKAFFAQYPEAEITDVTNDPMEALPKVWPNANYTVDGFDYMLGRDAGYPIKSYHDFFDIREETEREIDPILPITEAMSGLKPNEHIWLQMLMKPADPKEAAKATDVILNKIIGKKETPKAPSLAASLTKGFFEFLINLIKAPFVSEITWSEAKVEEKKPDTSKIMNPEEKNTFEAVMNKKSKQNFETFIRLAYIASPEVYDKGSFMSVASNMQLFNAFNFLRPTGIYKAPRFIEFLDGIGIAGPKSVYENARKRIFWLGFRDRAFSGLTNVQSMGMMNRAQKPWFFSTEEIATLYHPPVSSMAQGLRPIEAKKGAPPPNLPIEI